MSTLITLATLLLGLTIVLWDDSSVPDLVSLWRL